MAEKSKRKRGRPPKAEAEAREKRKADAEVAVLGRLERLKPELDAWAAEEDADARARSEAWAARAKGDFSVPFPGPVPPHPPPSESPFLEDAELDALGIDSMFPSALHNPPLEREAVLLAAQFRRRFGRLIRRVSTLLAKGLTPERVQASIESKLRRYPMRGLDPWEGLAPEERASRSSRLIREVEAERKNPFTPLNPSPGLIAERIARKAAGLDANCSPSRRVKDLRYIAERQERDRMGRHTAKCGQSFAGVVRDFARFAGCDPEDFARELKRQAGIKEEEKPSPKKLK